MYSLSRLWEIRREIYIPLLIWIRLLWIVFKRSRLLVKLSCILLWVVDSKWIKYQNLKLDHFKLKITLTIIWIKPRLKSNIMSTILEIRPVTRRELSQQHRPNSLIWLILREEQRINMLWLIALSWMILANRLEQILEELNHNRPHRNAWMVC